jgi:hypothetical protein
VTIDDKFAKLNKGIELSELEKKRLEKLKAQAQKPKSN